MKQMRLIALMLPALFATWQLHAQAVSTDPVTVTQSTGNIVITFHADGGNRGLMGSKSSEAIYAHTGVITSESTSPTDWKYATTWKDNSAKYKLTYAGQETWTLKIPDIHSFYGITDPDETVEQLCFVFRNATASREGKTATGGDIMVRVFPSGFPSSKPGTFPGGTPRMGQTVNADGSVTFCLAAPGKTNVLMMNSLNDFAVDASNLMSYQDGADGFRYFFTTVKGIRPGENFTYYYIVDGCTQVGDPYAHLIIDDRDDKYIPADVYPDIPAYPTHSVSAVPVAVYNSDLDRYSWKVRDFSRPAQSDLIIYELLIRDFTGTEGAAKGNGTVKGVISKLDYLKQLGVNAIELLPVMEFNGNNSWGYNTNFYMAPDKAYGTPDDYKALIDGAHERGMAVILDIVFNQSDGQHPWYGMYTRKSSPFYNGSAPHAYSVLNDWNQDCPLVQQQWYDALDYWMNTYKVDGFRFDLVKGLGDNSSYGTKYDPATNTYATPSDANTNRYNATRVARMKALHDHMKLTQPDAIFINEDLAGAQEENEMAADGETNWANINTQSCEYAMGYSSNASLNRFYAPLDQRTWGSTVSYAESHDEERVAYKVSKYGASGIKGNIPATMLRLGSLAAQMIITPGSHMIWQFEEFGADQTTKNTDNSNNTDPKKVVWSYLDNADRKGLHDTYAELINIRRANPDLFTQSTSTAVSLSAWNGRTVALSKGDKELYLLVNPATSGSTVVSAPKNPATNQAVNLTSPKYTLLAKSYGTSPTATASGARIQGGAFALYGSNISAGVDDVTTDMNSETPVLRVTDGVVECLTPYSTITVTSVSGVTYPPTQTLPSGVYIVSVDGHASKIIVR